MEFPAEPSLEFHSGSAGLGGFKGNSSRLRANPGDSKRNQGGLLTMSDDFLTKSDGFVTKPGV